MDLSENLFKKKPWMLLSYIDSLRVESYCSFHQPTKGKSRLPRRLRPDLSLTAVTRVVFFVTFSCLTTLCTLIIVHARLFFQSQFFGSARPYSGLHVYFSGQENRVYTIIQVCTIINFSYLSLHNYSGLPNN